MAGRRIRPSTPLPPPLPPETRTVGQLVAETVNLYRRRFWPSLALGLGPAAVAVGLTLIRGWWALAFALSAGALLMTASYLGAVAIATGRRADRRSLLVGAAVGYLVFVPAPFLYSLFILPAVAWLALFGLAVPAAVIERSGFRASLRRGFRLGRADYVHAAGSLATLVIVAFLTSTVLFFLLRGASQVERSAAAFLSLLVISPILFLGAALLYFDQAARSRTRRSNADVHHAVDADRPGRADAEGEPRPAAGGQS
ncbi:MAG: hypothetical protein WBB76_11380 [Gaiellaceae bacterium]